MKATTVNFPKNIYHYCQRKFVDRDLLDVLYKKSNRRLGALPYDWFQKYDKNQYAKLTRRVDKLFRRFAKLYSLEKTSAEKFNLQKKLAKLLKRDDVKIDFEGLGGFKVCQKVTVGDYSYALLTFRKEGALETDTLLGHGALVEPCRIFNYYRGESHGRVAKPFMTRFVNNSKASDFDGYMLMKFIDEADTARAKAELPEYQHDFLRFKKITDNRDGNLINGIRTDIGRLEENPYAMDSTEFRQNLFAFLAKTKSTRLTLKAKTPEEKLAASKALNFVHGLMFEGKDIYNMDLREVTTDLSELEQRYVIKTVRALKKAHKLKLKFMERGEYGDYVKYFGKYVWNSDNLPLQIELLFKSD